MDKVKEFIEKEVSDYRLASETKENETKEAFFTYLLLGYSLNKFKQWLDKKWDKSDKKQMDNSKIKLEKLVDEINQVEGVKSSKDFFETIKYKRFEELKEDFKGEALKYYKKRQEIASKVPDKAEYLKEFVSKYDKYMANIPYFKNGSVYSWHTLSDYTSMIYNTNLTRQGWNRTLTDSEKTGNDLLYLSAHPFACPLCMKFQGKYYSASDSGGEYPSIQTAIKGGVGHPNCKHVPTLALDSIKMQDNDFNSEEWEMKYKEQQKLMAVYRKKEKIKTDLNIYKKMNNQTEIDLMNAKLKKINQQIREIKTNL